MNPFSLLSFVLSSWLAFTTVAFAVESFFLIFRIQHFRLRAFLRLLPFASLGIDLFFKRLSLGDYFNPLSCASCVQKFFLEQFTPQLKEYLYSNRISLVTHLDGQIGWFSMFLLWVFCGVGLLMLSKRAVEMLLLRRQVQKLIHEAEISQRSVQSPMLRLMLQRFNVRLLESDKILIPVALAPNRILLPKENETTQEEFEAIISHELEHLRFKDPLMRLLFEATAALFWWLPLRGWINRIERDQEIASDQAIFNYGIEPHSLAEAILKVSRRSKNRTEALCFFATRTKMSMSRLKLLLGQQNCYQERQMVMATAGITFALLAILSCLFF